MTLENIVSTFPTTPYLFVGSGMSRRYLGLPSWKELLQHFASIISEDEFSYNSYVSEAKRKNPDDFMPLTATLIQDDYNKYWFSHSEIRTTNSAALQLIKDGVSPFKVEIAEYLKDISTVKEEYHDEVNLLRQISEKSVSGIITTNYDMFLENIMPSFKTYVGQKELIFKAIQGIAEIYKIHGSVQNPESIVITEEDYKNFDENAEYLAAKLMTIFMEYPIIFMGYSISDNNIQKILESIVRILNADQLKIIENRFIFVEYDKDYQGVEVTPFTIMVGRLPLNLTKIRMSEYSLLYSALMNKKSKLPVRLLRRFKEELYAYVISNEPTDMIRVGDIDDTRISDDDMVLSIGTDVEYGQKGLIGVTGDEWYRNIVLGDLRYSPDDLLENCFERLNRQNSNMLPFYKLLINAKESHPYAEKQINTQDLRHIISNSIRKNRVAVSNYSSVREVWENEKSQLERATRLIALLPEENIDKDELEQVLLELFGNNPNILSPSQSANIRTNIKRLIKIYDCIKYGAIWKMQKRKESSD